LVKKTNNRKTVKSFVIFGRDVEGHVMERTARSILSHSPTINLFFVRGLWGEGKEDG
jgi:hypothetical protein